MMVDRFGIYDLFDKPSAKSSDYTAYINTNYQFSASGYLKAFEAFVIQPGGIIFMVSFLWVRLMFLTWWERQLAFLVLSLLIV